MSDSVAGYRQGDGTVSMGWGDHQTLRANDVFHTVA